jgi:hypothetical protein
MSIGGRMAAIAAEARIETEEPEDLIMDAIVVADSVAGSAKSGKSEGDNVAPVAASRLLG